jgi:ribosomal protein S18 acetylase RimI-like enzyme
VRIDSDPWLRDLFGHAVYRVDPTAADAEDDGDATEALRRHLAGAALPAFYYAKVDTSDVTLVRALAAAGMTVVDVNVTLGVDAKELRPPVQAVGIRVADCAPGDAAAVLDIAGTAFQYSRFHLDPEVPRELAHRIKREWIANYVRGRRGEALLVAHVDGRPAGFLAVIGATRDGRQIRAIDLIAVDPRAHRRGIGRALVTAFISRFGEGAEQLQVGTQIANAPSLALYQQFGFTVRHSAYVLHMHAGRRAADRCHE